MIQIRDPIHGSIEVTPEELKLIDSPFFQRLRNIKQLGFGEQAFPGATHTRYAHSLGATHLASRVLDALLKNEPVSADAKVRMRQATRLAILFHDVGHAPLSHTSEATMPPLKEIALPEWALSKHENLEERAVHEHYTMAILLESDITGLIEKHFGSMGLTPESIVSLIAGQRAPGPNPFESNGTDYWPLLGQIVSGELDADRMDYLIRDSFYTGVNYGRYDLDWIIENMTSAVVNNEAHMGLHKRAVFAFEDFLLSRYHMFLSVYFHYTPICFDQMLRCYYNEEPEEYQLPSKMDQYLAHGDIYLTTVLRASKNRWAQSIVRRRPWRLIVEANEFDTAYNLPEIEERLAQDGIEAFQSTRAGVLSKYFGKPDNPILYISDPDIDRLTPIEDYTPLYSKYCKPNVLSRLYCDPDQFDRARSVVTELLQGAA